MTALFAPTSTQTPKPSWIHIIKDPSLVPRMNWAQFILDNLVGAVKEYKTTGVTNIGGCTLFFMVMERTLILKLCLLTQSIFI